jgi:hypothetical protein
LAIFDPGCVLSRKLSHDAARAHFGSSSRYREFPAMADLVAFAFILGAFALLGLAVNGVNRL